MPIISVIELHLFRKYNPYLYTFLYRRYHILEKGDQCPSRLPLFVFVLIFQKFVFLEKVFWKKSAFCILYAYIIINWLFATFTNKRQANWIYIWLFVGATDVEDTTATFSNYGTCVDIFAPGVSVLSTVPGDATSIKSGTSMAAPHVSGVVARYISSLAVAPTPAEVSVIIYNSYRTPIFTLMKKCVIVLKIIN